MKTKLLLLACLGLAAVPILAAAPASAQATRTWVSGVGDDVNPCSRTAPCKTFAGAISKTAARGEINCLDPAGYGAVTITKAITIDCTGTMGSILSSATNGVIVNAGATDRVVLRGLEINGTGGALGLNGIRFLAGAQLSVENVALYNFSGSAIDINKTAAGNVSVSDTFITGANKGIFATTTAGNVSVTVNNTRIISVTANAVETQSNAHAVLSGVTISNSGGGVVTTGISTIGVDNSTFASNTTAVGANAAGSTIRASNNNIYNNGINFNIAGGAVVLSGGNNRITGAGGSPPSGSITLQ